MALEPRFKRVAALHRPFVDREQVAAAFEEELQLTGGGARVLNVVGVGGIGKSRLLRELRDRSSSTHRTALIDLQVPAMRQQEDALAVLRVELGRQGVRFDRFDIAYAVLWQRLHPHLHLSRKDLPFARESEALTQIMDGAAGLPVFGTGVGLVKLLEIATTKARKRRRVRVDETLRGLDDLTNPELADAVTYYFAQDLRESAAERTYAIFVDAYEALAPSPGRSLLAASSDVWLRDLVAQLDRGLVVVASREPLGWEAHDPAWREVIRGTRVDGLPMSARLQLLSEGGIVDEDVRRAIAEASRGLPFYLHLALDTGTSARQEAVVSSEEILRRFLQHVGADEIRTLELLSVARVFDLEIFQTVADAFDLPRNRIAWESLTAYSFVYPAGAHGLRLHQLMREALRGRLSDATAGDVHGLLQRCWDARARRAEQPSAGDGLAVRALAVREAAYSGLQAGTITGAEVLAYADDALACGGKQAVDGLLSDLREADLGPELTEAARCLRAEVAIVLGDADTANRLTPRVDWPLGDTVGARLAMAAANGRRRAGATTEALEIFTRVWNQHGGPVRLRAGFWVADLDMWQGRMRDAFAMADRILGEAADDDFLLRGDVVRLAQRGHKYMLDLDASWESLQSAISLYERSGSVVEQANMKVNRAELLAWIDPARALPAAADALETQRQMSAQHEIGKACTALGVAQMRLGQHEESANSFQAAAEALERAGYRSGRARAEFFRAALHARSGRHDEAAASVRWTVAELVGAEVYPTLIMMSGRLLAALGVRDPAVEEAAASARARLRAPVPTEVFDERAAAFVAALLA
ncbi:hypothetical protein [Spirillospora sp. CA-294931]|uniref:hypothetical protein n=1 Tax=Spirillospora sp. CA-294931 TaxID=3240042 RepID=UPI003D8D3AF3